VESQRVTRLVYGRTQPEENGCVACFLLASAEAIERYLQADRARTWGEFAAAVGCTFAHLLDTRREELTRIQDGREPAAETPMCFRRLRGVWDVADLVPDPRTAAFEALTGGFLLKGGDGLRDEFLIAEEDGGEQVSVSAASVESFAQLARLLREQASDDVELRRDDAQVRAFLEAAGENEPEGDGE
jgi:hypothetical protein